MDKFNDSLHTITLSEDGSYTAYSKEYEEHYHSTKDGALHESLTKHVVPAFEIQKDKKEITILDICFGLGFNTLATLLFVEQNKITSKINIYSPELDKDLISSLKNFTYPKEFEKYQSILNILINKGIYSDKQFHIEIYLGDARKYIKTFEKKKFDIIYQDAFSPNVNAMLWTKEYFKDIKNIIKDDGVLTTYSIALAIRLALWENNFFIYLNKGKGYRTATLASVSSLEGLKEVDMKHKIFCNPKVKALRD